MANQLQARQLLPKKYAKRPPNPIGMLQDIKNTAGPLIGLMISANHRDRARKIYDLAKELQDDLSR